MEPDDRIPPRDEVPIEGPIRTPRQMSAAVPNRPLDRPLASSALPDAPVRWSGVWAGFLVAIGVLLLFNAAGAAIGVTPLAGATTPPGSLAPLMNAGTSIFAVIAFIVAVFIGGMIAARFTFAGLATIVQGSLVWVMSLIAVWYLSGFGVMGMSGPFAGVFGPTFRHAIMAQPDLGNNPVATTGTYGGATLGTSSGAWLTFAMIVASLAASLFGALIARRRTSEGIRF